jgi:probable F420-dependent oxidoreductase
MDLSTIGVFGFLDGLNGTQVGQFARKVERLGYSALWFAEGLGRESFSLAAYLLSQTERLVVATGIAVVFKRGPVATWGAAKTLAELFGDRFILGLGVSSKEGNARRGIAYDKPYGFMREYLAKMKSMAYTAPAPTQEPPVVLAALMPKMLQLAATETHGTHTYFVPPEHTAMVRAAIGPDKWICAEQAVMLEPDPAKARAAARAYMAFYLQVPHYRNSLRAVGFGDADFADGVSDRLVDAIVVWGAEDALRERIAAHYKAGATHVCILPLSPNGGMSPDERVLEALAPR